MTFVLASNNRAKLEEMRRMLSALGLDVVSQAEAGISFEAEETGETFFENALIKAEAIARLSGLPAIADDSGLVVEHLGGGPGVRSRRYGGGGLSDGERNALLLKEMEGAENRAAKFVSCVVCFFPGGGVVSAQGECRGTILCEPRGSGGFGYDPIFLVEGMDRSMAELTAEEKDAVSHRGRALREFAQKLREYIEGMELKRC